jgi:hypothetical protein
MEKVMAIKYPLVRHNRMLSKMPGGGGSKVPVVFAFVTSLLEEDVASESPSSDWSWWYTFNWRVVGQYLG